MLTVHHLDHSQSFRIIWLLEELDGMGAAVDYDLKLYKRNDSDRLAPPEYKALSPLGTSPTITTDTGFVLNESNAIMEYILDLVEDGKAKGLLRPAVSSPQRNAFLLWFHSVQGSLQPILTVDIVFRRAAKKTPFPISSIVKLVGSKVRDAIILPRLIKLFGMAEAQLQKHEFLAGSELTAADITAIYPFSSAFSRYPNFSTEYPKTHAWFNRLVERPAYKRAQAKVGEEDGIVFQDE